VAGSALFLLFVVLASLLPVLAQLSSTLFLNAESDLKPLRSPFRSINYMLVIQYVIVMFVLIMTFGIGRQMRLIRDSQMDAQAANILVMKEQPWIVKQRYDMLKTELLKHPDILSVTASMQLPGDAIRDGISIKLESEGEEVQPKYSFLLAVDDNFFPFFNIKPIAGRLFSPNNRTYDEEEAMMFDFLDNRDSYSSKGLSEEYILNKEALAMLGFQSADEAVGKQLRLLHGTLNYINNGTIVGVVDNFTYTSVFDKHFPLLIISRKQFLHCIMVRLNPADIEQSMVVFEEVWNKVNPDFPAEYTFLQDVYGKVYRNELNAEFLVGIFSLLCFLIADLGLIIFMAFVIKRRTKEIAIRKINGAKPREIVWMLNRSFMPWIGVSFVVAVPLAYFVMQRWLQHFAYQTSLDWWVFLLAGLLVAALSMVSVSWQSWRASVQNPAEAIKND
jgi:putative ABC transport system permease protein